MDGGQICFLEKMQVGEKHWPAFKNCFKAALWKFNHIGDNFLRTIKSLQLIGEIPIGLHVNTTQSYLKVI